MNEGRQHQQRGTETEATVTSELVGRGISVLTPAFGNERYDMVIDRDGDLERVQVKTAYGHVQKEQTVVVEFERRCIRAAEHHNERTIRSTRSIPI